MPLVIPYPAIDPIALQLGPISVKWYGIAYLAGLVLGWLYIKQLLRTERLWPSGKPALEADDIDDLLLWMTLGVVVGGRLGNVLLYHPGYYLKNPLEIFALWHGGMSFHGGLIGSVLAIWLFARRRKVATLTVGDLCAAAVPIGIFFGRIANFINAEIVGRPSNVPWAMVFPGAGPVPRHPSQLYEAALEGLALFLLLRFIIYRKGALGNAGLVSGVFLAGYAAARIFCELFKERGYRILDGHGLTTGMIYSVPMLLAGIYLIVRARRAARAADGPRAT